MALITIYFDKPLNKSCQIGDTAHYIPANQNVGGFTTHTASASVQKIGTILTIEETYDDNGIFDGVKIACEIASYTTPPSPSDFILFSKDRSVNESSIVGYYGAVKFENTSKEPAELFVATCEYTGSS